MIPILFNDIKVFKEISEKEAMLLSDFFIKNDYVLLSQILTDEIKKHLYENVTFVDSNAINDYRQFFREHNDDSCSDFINAFYVAIHPFYEFILQKKVTQFIGFGMKYSEKSELKPHYDNYNMPISSTICFYNKDMINYPILLDKAYFQNPYPFRLTVDDAINIPKNNIIQIELNEGDIAIFRGRNHLHWRYKKYIIDYRALLLHTEDYMYNNELIGYTNQNADVNNIKNINIYALTDLTSYDKFRKDYVMYF